MGAFLFPIEQPRGLTQKIAYSMTKKQFGKVPTPVKVVYARMPAGFGMFVGKIARLDKKLTLPQETQFLIRERVAQINVCEFCMDIGRYFVVKASMDEAKFNALSDYRTSPLFSEQERVALDYVTELTRNRSVAPETFERLRRHYSERAICEIVWLVASEHFYNLTNLGLNIHSDMLCDIARKH
jgi:alkylhydroperoxidase family enzyme